MQEVLPPYRTVSGPGAASEPRQPHTLAFTRGEVTTGPGSPRARTREGPVVEEYEPDQFDPGLRAAGPRRRPRGRPRPVGIRTRRSRSRGRRRSARRSRRPPEATRRGRRPAGARGRRGASRRARRCGSPTATGRSPAVVATACPVGSPSGYRSSRMRRHSARIAGPPTRWMAPSTPPPPRSDEFAALTIASTACSVMSPCTISIRIDDEQVSGGRRPRRPRRRTTPCACSAARRWSRRSRRSSARSPAPWWPGAGTCRRCGACSAPRCRRAR